MPMTYEAASSRDRTVLLVFPAGMWDDLPFEVRLARPWFEVEAIGHVKLTPVQHSEIASNGYCIVERTDAEASAREEAA
jgi:hypothetical protein